MKSEAPGKILLVEDNAKDLRLTMHALAAQGLSDHVDVVRDGEEALDYLFCRVAFSSRRFEDAPHIVLLDLKLPKVDGLEVLRAVKADSRTRAIPVVILTASKEETDMIQAYHTGANAYIQKPVAFDEFRRIVEQLGLFWLVVNRPPPSGALGAT